MRTRALSRASAPTLGLALALLSACTRPPAPRPVSPPVPPVPAQAKALPRLGYTIQAGAFAQVENAVALADTLQKRGLDAVYYAAPPGLYRVRFGDFPTREAARIRAQALKDAGIIREFYLVAPEEAPTASRQPTSQRDLRANLVNTSRSYLGVPYLWGGTSPQGFDCSGLTMAVYRLNGLQLPRTSQEQFEAGTPVALNRANPGDLVFFGKPGSGSVHHVGIYVGDGAFIHAPGRGRCISKDALDSPYFRDTCLGLRSYL